MRQININLSNKVFYTLILICVILLGGILVYAYGGSYGDPSIMGHTADEIDGLSSGGDSIPSGAVMAFNLASCPDGWGLFVSGQDRTIIGSGGSYALYQIGGEATHTLNINEMPSHTHSITGMNPSSTDLYGGNNVWQRNIINLNYATDPTGGNQPHNNMPPYIALLYCIKD